MPEGYVLGVDIGGTSIKLAIVSSAGEIASSLRYPTSYGRLEDLLDSIYENAGGLLSRWPGPSISAIGIGIKSLTDHRRQLVSSSSLICDATDIDLVSPLSHRFGVPAVIDNDVNAMAVAEAMFGWGRTRRDFMYVNVGTGVGVCPIFNGMPYRGARGWAGEISSCLLEGDARGIYPLETVASGAGCDMEARRLAPQYPDSCLLAVIAHGKRRLRSDEVFAAALEGDVLASTVAKNMLHCLAITLLNIEALMDQRLYVFGGGVVNSQFLSSLESAIGRLCPPQAIQSGMVLVPTKLGVDQAGIIGAASLALSHEWRR